MTEDLHPKRDAILSAAFTQFSRYGFRRTSMEDIAKETGISRASLYSHFENKEEIFRTLSASLHEKALSEAEGHLKGVNSQGGEGAQLSASIAAALIAKLGPFHEVLTKSEHGNELADENDQRCGDLVRDSQTRFQTMLTTTLKGAARNGVVDLKAVGLNASAAAELIRLGAVGLKRGTSETADLERKLRKFTCVLVRGLR